MPPTWSRAPSRAARQRAGRVTACVLVATIAPIGLGALAVLDAERGAPDANVLNFGDAMWWVTTTVTTVGHGDRFPVTSAGRLMAVALMLVGIALVGSVTAAVAAWFVEQVQVEREADERN